jgi:hypothetical protein
VLEPFYRAQLELFDLTPVLQDVEQDFDFPARSIPIDTFNDIEQRL